MSETMQKKTARKRKVIALGITCIILAFGLIGALAYSGLIINAKSSHDPNLSWTESKMSFELNATDSTQYLISTGGFKTLTIMISANSLNGVWVSPDFVAIGPSVFQVLVGSEVNGTLVDYQIYNVTSVPIFPHGLLPSGCAPWTSWLSSPTANSFEQTLQIHSSEILIWIWNNNSTINISGNVYYYLTA
jgi:hypothetical protein